MARPRKNDHRREELLQQGKDLLAEHGYHGTGLKKILDTVKVPKGSFYNYFESKEQFVSEIIAQYGRDAAEKLDDFMELSAETPVDAIRNVYKAITAEIEKNGPKGCLIGNLAAEIGTSSELCQKSMRDAVASWKKRFTSFISDAQDQGLIRNDLPAGVLCDVLWDTWQGALLKMKIAGNTAHLGQTLDVLLNHLFLPVQSYSGDNSDN